MPQSLLVCALAHLIRYHLTGCAHSAHVAAHLLDEIAGQPDVDGDTRNLCVHMTDALEARQGRACHV